ncbi:MAG TPA: histone H1 [Rhodothermales bacterium]|nr:histone H1 [Rhodothermales bacterium]
MSKFSELKSFVDGLEKDFTAFYDKGNKAAGTRVRKAMQDLKTKAQEIRSEVQSQKNTGGAA